MRNGEWEVEGRGRWLRGSALALLASAAIAGCPLPDAEFEDSPAECTEGAETNIDPTDCRKQVCQGGTLVEQADDSEIPNDSNNCTSEVCLGGTLVVSNLPSGLPVEMGQTMGDCKELQCDGMGSVQAVNDDKDTPPSGVCQVGTCNNGVPEQVNDQDGASCNGGSGQCMGGACKVNNGQPCAMGGECLSAFCTDGVCCNAACDGICAACNLSGKEGLCSQVAINVEDPGTCEGPKACTGSPGGCLLKIGQPCAVSADCISNSCINNPNPPPQQDLPMTGLCRSLPIGSTLNSPNP